MLLRDTLKGAKPQSWHPLATGTPWTPASSVEGGRLVFYYSPAFATLPCRNVMKLADYKMDGVCQADNKSDPNLETMTFGMWSTCDQHYRQRFGEDQNRYLFFRTNWRTPEDPVISGYYDVGWYLDSWYAAPPGEKRPARVVRDRFVAAKAAHFVAEPPHVSEVAKALRMPAEYLKRRAVIQFTPKQATKLKSMLDLQKDHTPDYVEETHRLEGRNLAATGVRYVNWNRVEGFDWNLANVCMSLAKRPRPSDAVQATWANGIKKNLWLCSGCRTTILSPRAIKICSTCADGGCFLPVPKSVNP